MKGIFLSVLTVLVVAYPILMYVLIWPIQNAAMRLANARVLVGHARNLRESQKTANLLALFGFIGTIVSSLASLLEWQVPVLTLEACVAYVLLQKAEARFFRHLARYYPQAEPLS